MDGRMMDRYNGDIDGRKFRKLCQYLISSSGLLLGLRRRGEEGRAGTKSNGDEWG